MPKGDFARPRADDECWRLRRPVRLFAAFLLTVISIFAVLQTSPATAATPTILNTGSNWLENLSSLGETNNSANRLRVTLAVKHDPGRKVTGIKIDDDWNGTDNTAAKAVKAVSAQQPTIQGGYDHSRISYNYALPTADTGLSCGAFGVGGTNLATKPVRIRAILDNGEETATSSTNIVFTRADCTGGEDFPYLYQWAQSDPGVNVGESVDFTFRGDDSDSNGNADFAGINWRLRRLSDGATTAPAKKCYSSPFDNADKNLTVTFPSRGRWVVEAELLNSEGCNTNNNAGTWAWIGAVDVNTAAATSPTASLNATRPQIGGNTTISATFADSADSAQGGRVQNVEWDLDGNTGNGVGGFEVAELGTWNTGLSSPRTRTINTVGMTPGLKTVRARVADNGALSGADNIRRQAIATTTYLIDTPPVATAQAVRAVSGAALPLTLAGTDVDGDSLTFTIVTAPEHGTLIGSGATPVYRSNTGFAGTDSFTFRAADGFGGTSEATVQLRVDPDVAITGAPSGTVASRGASVSFGSDVSSATFECSFDEGPWNPCSSARSFTDLPDGVHGLRVRVTAAGFTNSDFVSTSWTVDAFPEVVITSGPDAATADTEATVTFIASEGGSTTTPTTSCRLDNRTWRPCVSPQTYTDLDDGEHTISVRATDPFGKKDEAQREWTIATPPPSTSFDLPLPSELTSSGSISLGFSALDPDATFECRQDTADWEVCASPFVRTGFGNGRHTVRVRAVSQLGVPDPAPAVFVWEVDTVPPTVSVPVRPANRTTDRRPVFELASTEPGSVFECSIDSIQLELCAVIYQVPADLADGDHTFRVVAIDLAGNRSPVFARTFTVDTTAPVIQLAVGPTEGSRVNQVSAKFTFNSSEAGSTFECRTDAGDWISCVTPSQIEGLADGSHLFEVRSVDLTGNRSTQPAARSWTVDTEMPRTRIETGPSGVTKSSRAAFSFAADEPIARFHCSLDGSSFIPCPANVEYGNLADGSHELLVRATDTAGNQDLTGASRGWTVEKASPTPPDRPGPPAPEPVCVFGADLPGCGEPTITGAVAGLKKKLVKFGIDGGGTSLASADLRFPAGVKAIRLKSKAGRAIGSLSATGGTLGLLTFKLPVARKSTMVLAQRNGTKVTLTANRLSVIGLPQGTAAIRLMLRSTAGFEIRSKKCRTTTWRADLTDAAGGRARASTGADLKCAPRRGKTGNR